MQRTMNAPGCLHKGCIQRDGRISLPHECIIRHARIAVVKPETQVLQETIECTQWVFLIFSEAMNNHHKNTEYFRVRKCIFYSR